MIRFTHIRNATGLEEERLAQRETSEWEERELARRMTICNIFIPSLFATRARRADRSHHKAGLLLPL